MTSLNKLLSTAMLIVVAAGAMLVTSFAGTPGVINYQGRLTTAAGTPYPDGSYTVEFTIWGDSISTAPGYKRWSSGPVSVHTTDGVFAIGLGAYPMSFLNQNMFLGGLVWLGIKVGSDPELHPRIWFTSVPYAFTAHSADTAGIAGTAPNYLPLSGGTVTGVVYHKNDFHWRIGFDDRAALYPTTSRLSIFGSDTRERVRLSGNTSGQLGLWDNQATPVNTALLTAGAASGGLLQLYQGVGLYGAVLNGGGANGGVLDLYTGGGRRTVQLDAGGSLGGALHLWNANGGYFERINLDAGATGGGSMALMDSTGIAKIAFFSGAAANSSVMLPDSAIDSREILDEPGLAANLGGPWVGLADTWQDLITVTITIPAPGYVLVQGNTTGYVSSSGASAKPVWGYVQIEETPSGAYGDYQAEFGLALATTSNSSYFPISVHRIFYKTAGTYTFRLRAAQAAIVGWIPGEARCNSHMITAMYFPTSYGSVATLVSSGERGQFENSETVKSESPLPTSQRVAETMYRVDLRELELKAARVQAEADRLKRQVMEAKMKQMTQEKEIETPIKR